MPLHAFCHLISAHSAADACVIVCAVLFDLGGRVRLGAPVPLVAATALKDLKEHLKGASANLLSEEAQHHPHPPRPRPKAEEQRQGEIQHATALAKANDVRSAGEMLLELCTLKTIAEHGGTNSSFSDR